MMRWLKELFGRSVEVYEERGDVVVRVVRKERLLEVLRVLRDHTQSQYKCITDITCVDYPNREKRFEVVYILLSVRYSRRLRLKVEVEELESIESTTGLYKGSDWLEREVYDMFGIVFEGHGDLRRLLTDYGFEGHPLRKDFPLTGYREVRYDEGKKSVVSEEVESVY